MKNGSLTITLPFGTKFLSKGIKYLAIVIFFKYGLMNVSNSQRVIIQNLSPTVTFYGKNESLDKVFFAIEQQTGCHIWMDKQELKRARKVTINEIDAPIEKVLEDCFKHQPFCLSRCYLRQNIYISIAPQE